MTPKHILLFGSHPNKCRSHSKWTAKWHWTSSPFGEVNSHGPQKPNRSPQVFLYYTRGLWQYICKDKKGMDVLYLVFYFWGGLDFEIFLYIFTHKVGLIFFFSSMYCKRKNISILFNKLLCPIKPMIKTSLTFNLLKNVLKK